MTKPDGGAIPARDETEDPMEHKDKMPKMAVAVAQGASGKKPYVPPALEKRERLEEVTENGGPTLSGVR
jgi:hypothetical protein